MFIPSERALRATWVPQAFFVRPLSRSQERQRLVVPSELRLIHMAVSILYWFQKAMPQNVGAYAIYIKGSHKIRVVKKCGIASEDLC